ncbi:MAG: hypothetical protein H7Y04_02530 [Verrucomicrobia bacterium]|nr:hypothetical protein [Cytophagales bacterium]
MTLLEEHEQRLKRIEKQLLEEDTETGMLPIAKVCKLLSVSRSTLQRNKEKIGFVKFREKLYLSKEKFEEIKAKGF